MTWLKVDASTAASILLVFRPRLSCRRRFHIHHLCRRRRRASVGRSFVVVVVVVLVVARRPRND